MGGDGGRSPNRPDAPSPGRELRESTGGGALNYFTLVTPLVITTPSDEPRRPSGQSNAVRYPDAFVGVPDQMQSRHG